MGGSTGGDGDCVGDSLHRNRCLRRKGSGYGGGGVVVVGVEVDERFDNTFYLQKRFHGGTVTTRRRFTETAFTERWLFQGVSLGLVLVC